MGYFYIVKYFFLKNVILFFRLFNNLFVFFLVYMYKGFFSLF